MARVRTQTFLDGSYWDAECPDGWTFRQDRDVRGFPHVFEREGCRLQLALFDVRLDALNILLQWFGGVDRYAAQVQRHDFPALVGFTHPKRSPFVWAGWFVTENHFIYAILRAPDGERDVRGQQALQIMRSIQFLKEPSPARTA